MKHIPNLFTLLNLFFGCLAIIFVLQNGISILYSPDGTQLVDMPEKIWLSALFIGLAALVDFLDGLVARLLKADSTLGKELDSLADVVSFGVAPGMIMYQFLRMSFMAQKNGVDTPMVYLLPALLVPCAAAYRLARFNIDPGQQSGFKGVPSPAAGLLIASFPLIYWTSTSAFVVGLLVNKWVLYAIILFVSYSMVSPWRLLAFKMKSLALADNLAAYILVIATLVSAFLFHWLAVPLIFVLYIVLSLAFKRD